MKVLESTFKNMLFVLLLISAVAGFLLGLVHYYTKDRIAEIQAKKTLDAIYESLTCDYDNVPDKEQIVTKTSENEDVILYPALKKGELSCAAVRTFSLKGYSGKILLMVGLNGLGELQKIKVIEQKETPGLGTKIEDEDFLSQFFQKNPLNFKLKVKKDGGDVDAITAATISSRAFLDGVTRAHSAFLDYKKSRGEN